MVEIMETWVPVLHALLAAPLAWQTPIELADSLDQDVEETTDLLCDLDEAGWIEVWDRAAGPVVTLSALAAERLHVHIVEFGPEETPRWAHTGDPVPPPPRAKNVCVSERAAACDLVADPAPSPDRAAEWAELELGACADARAPGLKIDDLPWPTILVGLGLTPWSGPGMLPGAACPACGNRPLRPSMYCLCCDRWGLDAIAAALALAERPNHRELRGNVLEPYTRNSPQVLAKAELRKRERANRKAKRQVRHLKQLAAEQLGKLAQPEPPRPNRHSQPSSARAAR